MKNLSTLLALLFLLFVTVNAQNVPNGGFEEWEIAGNGTLEPVNWQANNLDDLTFVYQEPGHSGDYSARIAVQWDEGLGMNITAMLYYDMYFPVSERFTTLDLYLMGETLNSNYLMVSIGMYKEGINIGATQYPIYNDYADWTAVSVPISYATGDVPDECFISFTIWPADEVELGSYFFIDDVELGSGSGPTPPLLIAAFTNITGTAFELNFNTPMADPSGAQGQFTGTHNGSAVSFTQAALKNGDPGTIVLTLANSVVANETLKVSYSAGSVTSQAGVALDSFTDEEVTNLVGGTTGTWHQVPSGTEEPLYSVHFANSGTGYIGGGWGTFLKSSNGGVNWTPQDLPAQYDLLTVYAASPDAVHTGSWDTVYNTTNGGQSWNGVYLNTVNYWVMDLQFLSVNNGFMFLQASGFKKTTDGGSNWTELSGSGVIDDFHDGYMIDETNGFAVGTTGIIAHTNDGGQTWPQYEYNNWTEWSPITIEAVHFTSMTNGFAVADSGALFRTTDGGLHWTKSYIAGPNDHLMDIFFLNANLGWIVGYQGKIMNTTDGGNSWFTETAVTTNDLNSVFFITNNLGWAVGANGTILRFGDAGSEINENLPNKNLNLEIYPNPCQDEISFIIKMEKASTVDISIYDLTGRFITQVFNGKLPEGNQPLMLNTETLENGLYFCRVSSEHISTAKSFIINR